MAQFDLPASINYVLNKTGKEKLVYVGHSQGTTIGFAAFSSNQQLSEKIELFISLAPVAFVGNQRFYLLKFLASLPAARILSVFGKRNFSITPRTFNTIFPNFIEKTGIAKQLLIFMNIWDDSELDLQRLPTFFAHEPSTTSVQNLIHWAQAVQSKSFARFDHGESINMSVYGSPKPPHYKLSECKVPIAIFYGGKDPLSNITDIETYLLPTLPDKNSIVFVKKIDHFAHIDFVWGMKAPTEVYFPVLRLIK